MFLVERKTLDGSAVTDNGFAFCEVNYWEG